MALKLDLDKRIASNLRNAIGDENIQGIFDNLKKAYKFILDHYEGDDEWGYDEDSYERDIENIEDVEEYSADDYDEIDRLLGDFWDLCDNIRVWIPIEYTREAAKPIFTKKSKAKLPVNNDNDLELLTEADEGDEEEDNLFGDANDITLTGDIEKDFNNVVDFLKSQSYHDLGDALKDVINDPKLYDLLSKGFGNGELAKVKMSSSTVGIPVQQLFPTQSEIGLDNSLKFPLKSDCSKYFTGDTVTIVSPIITYRKTYVIDGHHRWSQLYMVNPDAKISAINFNYEDNIIIL